MDPREEEHIMSKSTSNGDSLLLEPSRSISSVELADREQQEEIEPGVLFKPHKCSTVCVAQFPYLEADFKSNKQYISILSFLSL